MEATQIIKEKMILIDGTIIEMVVWMLPDSSIDCLHNYKYRLYCGRNGIDLVRYDNEVGKGDHRHYGATEETYRFISLEQLIKDFINDTEKLK